VGVQSRCKVVNLSWIFNFYRLFVIHMGSLNWQSSTIQLSAYTLSKIAEIFRYIIEM